MDEVISDALGFLRATRGMELPPEAAAARDILTGTVAVWRYAKEGERCDLQDERSLVELNGEVEATSNIAELDGSGVAKLAEAIYELDRGWARMSVGRGGEITEEVSRLINGVVGAAFKAGVTE